MLHQEIVDFVERVKPELDSPGVYVPMINQYLVHQDQWGEATNPPTRVCYVMPVPEDAAIQNIGIAILLKIINDEMGPEFIGSVHYFPEAKMLKRMKKAGVPLFDNWLFHALSDFDILGFSSYYALQYLNFIPMLRLAGVEPLFENRKNDWNVPLVCLGGIQAYSSECVSSIFDAYFIGEGEEMNRKFFELYRKRKADGTSKIEFLYEAARTIQGIYLPWAYEFTYYGPEGDENGNHKNQIKEYHLTEEAKAHGVPLIVLKAAIEFRDRWPMTKSLVSNGSSGTMTIGSLFCANSCSNLCSFCQGSQLTLPYREIPFETAKKAAMEMVKNTGTGVLTPYSFNVSDLSYANRFTADILTEQHTKVTLSSERLDTIDDDFVKATIKSGSRSFTVAIEGACQPAGELVFTDRGYIPIEQVRVGDTINGNKVLNLYGGENTEGLYEIKTTSSLPVRFTGNHPVLVIRDNRCHLEKNVCNGKVRRCRPVRGSGQRNCSRCKYLPDDYILEFIDAKDLKVGDELLIDTAVDEWPLPEPLVITTWKNQFSIKDIITIPFDATLIKLCSFYVADGVLLKVRGNISGIQITWLNKNSWRAEDFVNELLLLNIPVTLRVRDNGAHIITISSKELGQWMYEEFGEHALEKHIPGWVFHLPLQLREVFINSYSDGSSEDWNKRNNSRIWATCNENIITSLVLLVESIGIFGSMSTGTIPAVRSDGLYGETKKPCHLYKVSYKQAKSITRKYKNYTLTKINSIKYIPGTNYVYNFETENHIYWAPFVVHNSPRGRHILNKNLTEDQILNAFNVLFRNGATKVKIYNISSWPFEQHEDIMYYANLVKKLCDIRDKYNNKTRIQWSFTPFNPKPHTMLQWSTMNDIELDENNEPQLVRTYDPMMPACYEASNNTISFRFGTTNTVSIVAFILNYGDRRLWPVMEAMANDPDVKYLGGMGIGSAGADAFIRYLREITGLDLDYYLRERDYDEIFPWEAISNGIDKSWLLMFYKKAKAASQTPVDQEGCLRKPCYVACTYCGVCRSLDKTRGNHGDSRNDDGSINKDYWNPEIYGEGRYLPIFAYGDNSQDHIGIEEKIEAYLKPQKYKVMRFGVDINPYYRYVDGLMLKYRLRRACLRAGVPLSAKVVAASDKILQKAYFSGKELFELYLTDNSFNMSESEIIRRVNNEFSDGCMEVTRVEKYSKAVKQLKNNFDFVLYSISLPNSVFSKSECDKEIEIFEASEFYPVKIRQRSKEKMGQFEVVTRNAKEMTYCCFNKDNNDGTWTLFAALSDNLAIYDFASSILHTAKRNLYRYPAIVEEFLLKSTMGSSFDMFADACEICGGEIETNIWGEPVDECRCLKHKFLSDFKRRDVDVSENSEDFANEMDDEDRFDRPEVTMDDDTDLEDYVLKKSGTTSV